MADDVSSVGGAKPPADEVQKRKGNPARFLEEAQRLSGVAKDRGVKITALEAENAALKQKIRGFEHKAVFDRIAAEAGVYPEALDDAFAASGYEPKKDEADETAIRAAVEKLKTTKKFFFGSAKPPAAEPAETDSAEGETSPEAQPYAPPPAKSAKPKPAPGGKPATATAPPASGGKVKASQLADPSFIASKTPKEMAALIKAGVDWQG